MMDNQAIKILTVAAKSRLREIRRLANYEPTVYDVELIHTHSREAERFVDLLNKQWAMVVGIEGKGDANKNVSNN